MRKVRLTTNAEFFLPLFFSQILYICEVTFEIGKYQSRRRARREKEKGSRREVRMQIEVAGGWMDGA